MDNNYPLKRRINGGSTLDTAKYTNQQIGLLHKLINNTPYIYYIVDKDWRFILSEGQGLKELGFEPGQLVGVTIKDLYGDDPEIMESIESVFRGETRITHTDAAGMHFETHFIPWFDEEGEVELLTCISTNITKRVQIQNEIIELNKTLESKVEERTEALSQSNEELLALNQELQAMNEEIQAINEQLHENNNQIISMQKQLVESEKMAALGNLVAGVAHEVNTPIGVSITAATHLSDLANTILAKKEKGEDIIEDLEYLLEDLSMATNIINKNLTRAGALVQSFKQLSVDQTTEDKRDFEVGAYIDEIILSLSPSYKKSGVLLEHKYQKEVVVNGWPGALAQIITNLMFNATQHAFGNDKGKITINTHDEGDFVRISFKDNGKGIDDEMLSKIFDPFYTTRRHQGGTGLGLSVVYSLVTQRYKGTIECRSELGKGTEFTIRIPKNNEE